MRQIGLHIGIAQRMRFILCAPCYHQSISAQNDTPNAENHRMGGDVGNSPFCICFKHRLRFRKIINSRVKNFVPNKPVIRKSEHPSTHTHGQIIPSATENDKPYGQNHLSIKRYEA